ncbi:MAG: hypothetical protein Q9M43_10725 [Sulfurimonas sp.]|nr:hypothetical protein [Sulfurimonas sp.]
MASNKAGIVHEDEWVAPKWMIDKNPSLFNALEMHKDSGKSSVSNSAPSASSSTRSLTKIRCAYMFNHAR